MHEDAALSWSDALKDAQDKLLAARRRVRELQIVVKGCQAKIRTGERFPSAAALAPKSEKESHE